MVTARYSLFLSKAFSVMCSLWVCTSNCSITKNTGLNHPSINLAKLATCFAAYIEMESFDYLSLRMVSRGPCKSFSYFSKGQKALVNSFFSNLSKGSFSLMNRFSHIKPTQNRHLYLLRLFLCPCIPWILPFQRLIKIKTSNHLTSYFVKGTNTADYPSPLH